MMCLCLDTYHPCRPAATWIPRLRRLPVGGWKWHQRVWHWVSSGKHTKNYWTWPFTSSIYPSKMAIFHGHFIVYQRGSWIRSIRWIWTQTTWLDWAPISIHDLVWFIWCHTGEIWCLVYVIGGYHTILLLKTFSCYCQMWSKMHGQRSNEPLYSCGLLSDVLDLVIRGAVP